MTFCSCIDRPLSAALSAVLSVLCLSELSQQDVSRIAVESAAAVKNDPSFLFIRYAFITISPLSDIPINVRDAR